MKISETRTLDIYDGKRKVAVLYPQHGLDGIIKAKKAYHAETDERNYWRLKKDKEGVVLDCQTRD